MKISIEPRGDYLLAELRGRESAADMREFLLAVKAACQAHGLPKILLSIRDSRTVFKAEEYGLSGYVKDLVTPECRIALLGDSSEHAFAHEYIEVVARQQQVNVRSFRNASAAVAWLKSATDAPASNALQPGGAPELS